MGWYVPWASTPMTILPTLAVVLATLLATLLAMLLAILLQVCCDQAASAKGHMAMR
jgi:hypothetical protein